MPIKTFNRLYRAVALAGVDIHKPEEYNAIKTSNLLSIVAIAMIFMQLPLQMVFWTQCSPTQILLNLTHPLLLSLVPYLNSKRHFFAARIYLVLVYSTYIGLSFVNFYYLTNVHYFFSYCNFCRAFSAF